MLALYSYSGVFAVVLVFTFASLAAIVLVVAIKLSRRIHGARMLRLTERIRPAILQTAVSEQDEVDDNLVLFRSLRGRARRSAESMATRMLYDVTGETRTNLTHILIACGTIERAVARTTSSVPVRRARAAEILGLIDSPDAVGHLIRLAQDDSAEVRSVATRALGRTGRPEAITALLAALPSSSGVPAVIVGSALLEVAHHSAAAIGAGFTDKDPAVRRTTAILASHVMSPGATPRLIHALSTDDEPLVRIAAARSLMRLQPRDAVQPLYDAASSEHSGVRVAATTALATFPPAWTLAVLKDLRHHPDVDIRRAASAVGG
ncbi:HEAT repeat domain-containing protein [Mycetocola sp. 2940]|uniref:HEAT repeat domain-containing protein n=1 Tax=Mycetocola sp. 2940 TaxID=3156452 RepID=UPI00339834DB